MGSLNLDLTSGSTGSTGAGSNASFKSNIAGAVADVVRGVVEQVLSNFGS